MSEAEFQEIMNQMPEEYSQNPNKYQNYWFKGDWSFEIPVTVDNSLTETLEINETNEEGIGLAPLPERLMKSPLLLCIKKVLTATVSWLLWMLTQYAAVQPLFL